MAKKNPNDLQSWNFIIFLTLAFMLIVGVVSAINNSNSDWRTKAAPVCAEPEVPEFCDGKIETWTDASGCLEISCVPN